MLLPEVAFVSSFAVYESTGDISLLLSCEGVGEGAEEGGGRLAWDRGVSTMSQTTVKWRIVTLINENVLLKALPLY